MGRCANRVRELRYVTGVAGERETGTVRLSDGVTGAEVLGTVLRQAIADFPEAFAGMTLPADAGSFKARLAELLPQFEAARIGSPRASAIARAVSLGAAAHLRFVSGSDDDKTERSLGEYLRESAEALPLVRVDLPGPGLLSPSAQYEGRLYIGDELGALASELERTHLATRAAAQALRRVMQTARSGLSLAGERFVLFGAGAELSPVYTLLEAGAEVLWLDRDRPPIDQLLEPRLGGALLYVDRGVDVLRQPAALRATIVEFARGAPVHIGMHAFAAGQACPLLLSLTMNEIVRSLPSTLVQSISYLLSPTSVSPIAPEDARQADQRQLSVSGMRRALLRTGSLQPGHFVADEQRLSRAVVPQQGASFQVAEYVGKRLMAEALLAYGSTLGEGIEHDRHDGRALGVFANMLPITATRTLASPLMEAALLGAASYDIMIAQPVVSRSLAALMLLDDVLGARSKTTRVMTSDAQRRAQLFAKQVHGGVHAQPFALDGIVRMAALKGLAQRPKLAIELLR